MHFPYFPSISVRIVTSVIMHMIIFIKGLGLTNEEAPQFGSFEEVRQKFTEIFSSKTQEEWCEVFDYVDACVTPVLTMEEATSYHHNKNKGSFLQVGTSITL